MRPYPTTRAILGPALTLGDIQDGQLVINRVKGSLRTVQGIYRHQGQPLLDEVKALASWRKVRPDDGSNALFVSREGGHISREQIYRIFRQYAETAGLAPEKRFVHILKHSLATHMVASNTNLSVIQMALGHASLSSTQAYVHVSDAAASEARHAAMMRLF